MNAFSFFMSAVHAYPCAALASARTGDEFNAPLFIAIAAVSAVLLIAFLILSQRAKKKNKAADFSKINDIDEIKGFGEKPAAGEKTDENSPAGEEKSPKKSE